MKPLIVGRYRRASGEVVRCDLKGVPEGKAAAESRPAHRKAIALEAVNKLPTLPVAPEVAGRQGRGRTG